MPDRKIDSTHLMAAAKAFEEFARVHGYDATLITVSLSETGVHFSTQLRTGAGKTEITIPFLLTVSEWKAARESEK